MGKKGKKSSKKQSNGKGKTSGGVDSRSKSKSIESLKGGDKSSGDLSHSGTRNK